MNHSFILVLGTVNQLKRKNYKYIFNPYNKSILHAFAYQSWHLAKINT